MDDLGVPLFWETSKYPIPIHSHQDLGVKVGLDVMP
jgi:hypothetical protein